MAHTFHRYRVGDEPVAGYRLVDHLGAGGFGEVWKATAPGGTEVALKIIDLTGQQGVQEFASLRVVKKVRHPNLISLQAFWMKDEEGKIVDEAGETAPDPLTTTASAPDPKRQTQTAAIASTAFFSRPVELLIAMQLGAKSLHKRLEECREEQLVGVPVAELLEYLEQAARGIDFLNKPIHDLGKGPVPIVHGDIKPHNILVVGDAAVVCDFGLARAVETLRKTSMAPVTVAYAAPESFKGKVTPTSDQYSLAITYAELRTGRLPFDETMTPYQVMEAHVTRGLDFSRLPEMERHVVLRATDPDSRWASSRDLILALRQVVAESGELPLRPGEMPFMGGATAIHSLTQRPGLGRDTDRPTQLRADPHGETTYPRSVTPSKLISQRTDAMPPSPPGSDSYAETSLLPPQQPPKKGRGLLIGGVAAAAVAVLAVVTLFVLNQKSPATNSTTQVGPGVATEVDPNDPVAQYIKSVQDKINEREFADAVDLLSKPYSKVPPNEIEALQRRLKEAFVATIGNFIERRDYSQALVKLEDAPSGVGLTADNKAEQREKIRTDWLGQAQQEFTNGQFDRAAETAGKMLRWFSDDRDASFILVRSQLRLEDYPAAGATLEKIGKSGELPAEFRPLQLGLTLLIRGADSAAASDPAGLLDGFVELTTLEKTASAPAAIALNDWERGRLTNLRSRTVESVEQLLKKKTLPPEQTRALLEKLEQLGSNAELQLFKVKSLVEAKQFAEARTALQAIAVLEGETDLKNEVAAQELLIDLSDPSTNTDTLQHVFMEALATSSNVSRSTRAELSAAAESLALGSQPTLLEPAIQLVDKASELDALDQTMTARLARLLVARLTQVVAQPTPYSPEQLRQIIEDCRRAEAAELNTGLTDSLYAECLLTQGSRDRELMLALVQRAKPTDAYTDFVKARVLGALPQADWPEISKLLLENFAEPGKLPSSLAVPSRRAEAAKLLTEAALKNRIPGNQQPGGSLTNPYASPEATEEAFRLLELANQLANPSKSKLEAVKLADDQQRKLASNLALTAAWKAKPDWSLAASNTAALLKLNDAELGSDALPILLAAFRSNEKNNAASAIQAARRFVELFQKQFPIADQQAVEVYNQLLKPSLKLADAQSAIKPPLPELDKFYGAAADFVSHYKRATWPFGDKSAEQEKLLGRAIALNSKVPQYHTDRGAARVSQTPPNLDGALADAEAALKLDAKLPAAMGLQSHALIYRSRQQPTRESRLNDLDQALEKSLSALKLSKPDDKQHGTHLLYASMAHLERANFDNDPQAQQKLLLKAHDYAQQAVDQEKAYPDYAYVALGNALEDLAWLAAVDQEKNYLAAIEAFSRAIENNPTAPDAWIGRARCFYKALADSKLDPAFLGRTKEEAMQAAISDLEQAKLLRPEMIEPNLWIGKAYQQLGKFDDADSAFATAVRLADEQKLPEKALYLAEWSRNAVVNPTLVAADRSKVLRERAEKLKTAPNLGGSSNAKQAAILVGQSLMLERKLAEALKEYDAALADCDKLDPAKPLDPNKADGADVSLFLARAACRLSLPDSEWNLTTAQNTIRDAVRAAQLKPPSRFESLAHYQAAQARFRSIPSSSATITAEQKRKFLDEAIVDVRNAVRLAPADPASWEWRVLGTKLVTTKLSLPGISPEAAKKLGTEGRSWIDEAITMAAKRPDLAGQLDALQRLQQQLDASPALKNIPRS